MKKNKYFIFILFTGLLIPNLTGCFEYFETAVTAALSIDIAGTESDNSTVIRGIAVGDSGKVYITSGLPPQQWSLVNSGTSQKLNFTAIRPFSGTGFIYAVGNNGTVLRSQNFGQTWIVLNGITAKNLNAMDYYSETDIYAAGDSGTVIKSQNSGSNWSILVTATQRKLTAVSVSSQNVIIIVGEKGTVLKTTNGGSNWQDFSFSDTTVNFSGITKDGSIETGGRLWAAANNGRIYTSTNGTSWLQQISGTTQNLRCIKFRNSTSGVVAGDNGTVRYTTNGGNTWITDPYLDTLTSGNINSIAEVNGETFAALSGNNMLIYVSSQPFIAITPISSEIPFKHLLYQNYPNPFNPSTVIRFDISEISDTKLAVYDILGKELITLVNEKLKAGSYEISYEGSENPSGVYFYRLRTNNFSETKKMLMIK